jgi:hypothetical protein
MRNFSRNAFSGTVTLRDSASVIASKRVQLETKDQVVTDSLFLPATRTYPIGDMPMYLELSGKGGARELAARGIRVNRDTSIAVGIRSRIPDSPVRTALRVIGYPNTIYDKNSTIIVDRDGLADIREVTEIVDWVASGGNLVVFPQHSEEVANELKKAFGMWFRPIRSLPPTAPVEMDETVTTSVNRLKGDETNGWVADRASYVVESAPDAKVRQLIRGDDATLVARRVLGRGSVMFVAVDFWPQFVNLHPGAISLFANLLALH